MSAITPIASPSTIGGNALNFSFEGQNLSANDVSHISITGDFFSRSDRTFQVLGDKPTQVTFANVFIDPLFVADRDLAAHVTYNAATGKLEFQGRMSTQQRDFLLHPKVLTYKDGILNVDADGNPILAPAPFTADASAINALYANSQDIPASGLAFNV